MDTNSRLIEVETQLLLLQRDFESLNQVVLDQRKEIDLLHQQILTLRSQIDDDDEPEVRDPGAERPPHY